MVKNPLDATCYMKNRDIIILIIFIILFFLIGLFYDIEYRTLTRTLIFKMANYDLKFYGGKEIRFFIPDLGFILTLIPIGFYSISKIPKSKNISFVSILIYIVLLLLFYLTFSFLESQIIKYTSAIDTKNIYHYHHNNINYRLIAIFSIVFSLSVNFVVLNILKRQKPILEK